MAYLGLAILVTQHKKARVNEDVELSHEVPEALEQRGGGQHQPRGGTEHAALHLATVLNTSLLYTVTHRPPPGDGLNSSPLYSVTHRPPPSDGRESDFIEG